MPADQGGSARTRSERLQLVASADPPAKDPQAGETSFDVRSLTPPA